MGAKRVVIKRERTTGLVYITIGEVEVAVKAQDMAHVHKIFGEAEK